MTTPPAARTAHGPAYWLLVGWWWGPTKWLGRVLLWLFLLPVGIWRSVAHGRKTREAKQRRGAEAAAAEQRTLEQQRVELERERLELERQRQQG